MEHDASGVGRVDHLIPQFQKPALERVRVRLGVPINGKYVPSLVMPSSARNRRPRQDSRRERAAFLASPWTLENRNLRMRRCQGSQLRARAEAQPAGQQPELLRWRIPYRRAKAAVSGRPGLSSPMPERTG